MDNKTVIDPNNPGYHYPVRSDLFPSNSEHVNSREDIYSHYAHNLHEKLLQDVHRNEQNYDCFKRPEQEKVNDPLFSSSRKLVEVDRKQRKKLGGPTICQTKFHASYWKVWNKERDLLEKMSRDEIIKEMHHKIHSTIDETKVVVLHQRQPAHLSPQSRTGKGFVKASSISDQKSTGVISFDGNKTMDDHFEKFETFDSHLMNDVPVKALFDMSRKPNPNTNGSHRDGKNANRRTVQHKLDLSYIADPQALGKGFVKGGGLSRSDKFSKIENSTTSRCDVPPLSPSIQHVDSHNIHGGGFSVAKRFSNSMLKVASAGGNTVIPLPSTAPEISFSQAPRFKSGAPVEGQASQTPGPGTYDLPRLMDAPKVDFLSKNKVKDFKSICEKYLPNEDDRESHGLLGLSQAHFTSLALYCYGCNEIQHIRYGMCRDNPNCGQKSNMEQAIIRRNDLRRLAGLNHVEKLGKNKDSIQMDIALASELSSLVDDPVYKMTALYTAAFMDDIETIEVLSTLGGGVNPNVQQEESGFTALHIAVARKNVRSVFALVNCFRGKIDLHRQDFIRGESPLHISSRQGYVEITSILCQEESCDPLKVANFGGKYPLDLVANHQCFQYIKAAIERNSLLNQIKELSS